MQSLDDMNRGRNELVEINLNIVFELFFKLRLLDRDSVQHSLIDCAESESIGLGVGLPGLEEYSYALQRDTSLDSYGSDGWNRGYKLLIIHRCPELDTIYQQRYRLIRDLYNGLLHYHKESTEIHRIESEQTELIYLSECRPEDLMWVDY